MGSDEGKIEEVSIIETRLSSPYWLERSIRAKWKTIHIIGLAAIYHILATFLLNYSSTCDTKERALPDTRNRKAA
eukprot:scaffold516132_cov23-Prasinocladus_malaysianus.AAC.1